MLLVLGDKIILLLLLSRFRRVWLCATPQMAAHQAPPSLGFSRQEHWSGLPFLSPMHKSKKQSKVAQSCPPLSDPMGCSLPGSSAHGIFQARVLEWGAIAFSNVKLDTVKFWEENTGRTLFDINHSIVYYYLPPRIMKLKNKQMGSI